jgi:hypothetical protein
MLQHRPWQREPQVLAAPELSGNSGLQINAAKNPSIFSHCSMRIGYETGKGSVQAITLGVIQWSIFLRRRHNYDSSERMDG